jgi:hypothetical protein
VHDGLADATYWKGPSNLSEKRTHLFKRAINPVDYFGNCFEEHKNVLASLDNIMDLHDPVKGLSVECQLAQRYGAALHVLPDTLVHPAPAVSIVEIGLYRHGIAVNIFRIHKRRP